MSVFVNGGGDTFKYKKIVENSVENHGLGWVTPGNAIVAETSISTSDWEESLSKSTPSVHVSLTYISSTDRIVPGTTYVLTVTREAGSRALVTTQELEGTAYGIAPNVYVDFPFNLTLADTGSSLSLSSPSVFAATVQLDEAPTYNKIDNNFIDSAYIVEYDMSTETGNKTYAELVEAYNSGTSMLLKLHDPSGDNIVVGAFYLPLTEYSNFINAGSTPDSFIFSAIMDTVSCGVMSVLVYEDSGSTVYELVNGTLALMQQIQNSLLPQQTGNSGKFLTTNGSTPSWTTPNFQPKYTISATTILASGWSNGSYSAFQTTYPAASYDVNVELNGDSITSAQQKAWNAAQIVGSATTNVLKALGDVPTIDIPVIVKATPL